MKATKFACRLAMLMCAMFLALSAVAQNVSTADLRGVVKDANGGVVSNATVTMHDEAKNTDRTVTTNDQGEYLFSQLPPGNYTAMITAATIRAKTTSAMFILDYRFTLISSASVSVWSV